MYQNHVDYIYIKNEQKIYSLFYFFMKKTN